MTIIIIIIIYKCRSNFSFNNKRHERQASPATATATATLCHKTNTDGHFTNSSAAIYHIHTTAITSHHLLPHTTATTSHHLLPHINGKSTVRPITDNDDAEGKQRYSFTLSLTSALDGGGWLTPRTDSFLPGKTRYHCTTGGWVGLGAGLKSQGKSRPRRGSNSGPSTFIWNVPVFVNKNYLIGTTNGGKHPVYPSLATLPPEHACSDPLPHTECARQSLPCWLEP